MRRCASTFVSHIDLLPTLLELLGAKDLLRIAGRSFVPSLKSGASPATPVFLEWTQDASRVTAASPAHAGEVLIAAARNLGPTRPDLLPPGSRPFKENPLEIVNSPVEVTVNGNSAEVVNKIGWPGTSDLYRVDFRVPEGIAPGMAAVQLTAAWIPGPEVKIPVR